MFGEQGEERGGGKEKSLSLRNYFMKNKDFFKNNKKKDWLVLYNRNIIYCS